MAVSRNITRAFTLFGEAPGRRAGLRGSGPMTPRRTHGPVGALLARDCRTPGVKRSASAAVARGRPERLSATPQPTPAGDAATCGRAEGVGGEAVDGIALRAALVIGHAKVLEPVKQVVAHPRRAPVFEVVVDHHAGHPDQITDELQAHADDHEPDNLSDLGIRQDGQKQGVNPVPFWLIRQDAVDQDGERPRF
jgi:hypothetical protein